MTAPSVPLALDEPVVILTGPRSGSTLLRYLLDAHPELACPPETNIIRLCAQLASICHVLAGPGPQAQPEGVAAASVRAMLGTVLTDYLSRQGKLRWCDKSLGIVDVAEPFLSIYPKTKFICLYRHCMDVIDSALEAAPWGLTGYGLDDFAIRFPGNSVAAVAAFWSEFTGRALDFEEAHPDRCHRVYYEDLVSAPEETISGVFSFIGAAPAPGLTGHYMPSGRGWHGPGDHKITATSGITADSVGRGLRIPVDLMHPDQQKLLNRLLSRLGYAEIDDDWRRSLRPPVLLRHRGAGHRPGPRTTGPAGDPSDEELLDQMGDVVRARVSASLGRGAAAALLDSGVLGAARSIGIAAYGSGTDPVTRCWRVDVDRIAVTDASADVDRIDWLVTGDIGTWSAVLGGYENFAASMRSRALRYISLADDEPPVMTGRLANARMMAMQELIAASGGPGDD